MKSSQSRIIIFRGTWEKIYKFQRNESQINFRSKTPEVHYPSEVPKRTDYIFQRM